MIPLSTRAVFALVLPLLATAQTPSDAPAIAISVEVPAAFVASHAKVGVLHVRNLSNASISVGYGELEFLTKGANGHIDHTPVLGWGVCSAACMIHVPIEPGSTRDLRLSMPACMPLSDPCRQSVAVQLGAEVVSPWVSYRVVADPAAPFDVEGLGGNRPLIIAQGDMRAVVVPDARFFSLEGWTSYLPLLGEVAALHAAEMSAIAGSGKTTAIQMSGSTGNPWSDEVCFCEQWSAVGASNLWNSVAESNVAASPLPSPTPVLLRETESYTTEEVSAVRPALPAPAGGVAPYFGHAFDGGRLEVPRQATISGDRTQLYAIGAAIEGQALRAHVVPGLAAESIAEARLQALAAALGVRIGVASLFVRYSEVEGEAAARILPIGVAASADGENIATWRTIPTPNSLVVRGNARVDLPLQIAAPDAAITVADADTVALPATMLRIDVALETDPSKSRADSSHMPDPAAVVRALRGHPDVADAAYESGPAGEASYELLFRTTDVKRVDLALADLRERYRTIAPTFRFAAFGARPDCDEIERSLIRSAVNKAIIDARSVAARLHVSLRKLVLAAVAPLSIDHEDCATTAEPQAFDRAGGGPKQIDLERASAPIYADLDVQLSFRSEQ
jgi:hypothetical protein